MGPATRQDVQNIVDIARNRITERTVTKQDISALSDSVRQLNALHQQSQQLLKQGEYQHLQLNRRIEAVEARITSLESEIRSLAATMSRSVEQRQKPVIMTAPTPAEQQATEPGMMRQYGYEPY